MTTFQDQPLSRRAVRQQEREQAQPGAVPPTGDADQPRAPQQGGQPAEQPEVEPEPLTYVTQNRPPLPTYASPPASAQPAPTQPSTDSNPEQPSASPASEGTYRPRDFSPEGRRTAAPTWAPQFGGVTDEGAIEYQTQGRAPQVPDATPPAAPPAPVDGNAFAAVEQTMTRRELRALRVAHDAARSQEAEVTTQAATASSPVIPEVAPAPQVATASAVAPASPSSAPVEAERPEPVNRLNSAVAEFDQLIDARGDADAASRGRRASAPATNDAPPESPEAVAPAAPAPTAPAPQPIPLVEPPSRTIFDPPPAAAPAAEAQPSAPFDQLLAPPSADQIAPAEEVARLVVPEPSKPEPSKPEPSQPARVTASSVGDVVVDVRPSSPLAAPAAEEPEAAEDTNTPPTGHWSTQADLEDEAQIGSATLAGGVGIGSAPLTTSALVLPSIPTGDFAPISGEILLTGSIVLPDSLASTGAHPTQLDESDLDHVLDPGDHQVVSADSAPVRAIRAVSTHTSSRNVIATVKPRGNRALTVLIVAASSMAAVVVTLLIVGMASGQL